MNYPLSDCHSCGNSGTNIKGCHSCGEPYNHSSKDSTNCNSYRRTNECYRPECLRMVKQIDAYNEM